MSSTVDSPLLDSMNLRMVVGAFIAEQSPPGRPFSVLRLFGGPMKFLQDGLETDTVFMDESGF